MAVSFVSKVLEPTPYVQPIDSEVYRSALLYKQQKFDQGVQAVDTELKRLKTQGAGIINLEKRDYYERKQKELLDQVNKLGGMDFSERSTLQQIEGLASQITDDETIQEALQETRSIQNQYAYIEKLKSDPKKYAGLYSSINENDFNGRVMDYATAKGDGNGKGIKWGGYKYVNYKDLNDLLGKKLKDIRDFAKKNGNTYTGNDGYMYNLSALTPAQVARIAQQELAFDPELNEQMRINARYGAGQFVKDPVKFAQKMAGTIDLEIENYTKQKKAREELFHIECAKATTTADQNKLQKQWDDERKAYDEYIQERKETKAKIQSGELAGEELFVNAYQHGLINSLSSEYAFASTTMSADPTYISKLNLIQKQEEFQHKRSMDYLDYNLHANKNKAEIDHLRAQTLKLTTEAENNTGLTAKKNGTYGPDDYAITERPNEGGSIEHTTLETLNQDIKTSQDTQVALLQEAIINSVGKQDLAQELRKHFYPKMNPDGTIRALNTDKSVMKDISPQLMRMMNEQLNLFNRAVRGEALSQKEMESLSSEKLNLYSKIKQEALYIKNKKEAKANYDRELSALMPVKEQEELAELRKGLESGKYQYTVTSNTGFGIATAPTPQALRYQYLTDKYETNKEKIKLVDERFGHRTRGALITGDKLKDEYGSTVQLIRTALDQGAFSLGAETDKQLKEKLNQTQGNYVITSLEIIPTTREIEVKMSGKNAEGDVVKFDPVRLNYTGKPVEWAQLVPPALQVQLSPRKMEMDYLLKNTGGLGKGKDRFFYHYHTGKTIIGASVIQDTSGTNKLFFQTPELGEFSFVPPNHNQFQSQPIEWMDTTFQNWLREVVIPGIRIQKKDPNYQPTTNDVITFFKNATSRN